MFCFFLSSPKGKKLGGDFEILAAVCIHHDQSYCNFLCFHVWIESLLFIMSEPNQVSFVLNINKEGEK